MDLGGLSFGILPKYVPIGSKHAAQFFLSANPAIVIEVHRELIYDPETLKESQNRVTWNILGESSQHHEMQLQSKLKEGPLILKGAILLQDLNKVIN